MFILEYILMPLMALFKSSAMHSQDMALNANYAKTVLFSLKWALGEKIRHRQAYSAHQVGSLPVQNMDLSDCKGSCQFGLPSLSRAVSSVNVGSSSLYHIEGMHCCLPIDNMLPESCYFLICLLVAVKTAIH